MRRGGARRLLAVGIAVPACVAVTTRADASVAPEPVAEPAQVIVELADGVDPAAVADALGVDAVEPLVDGVVVAELPDGVTVADATATLDAAGVADRTVEDARRFPTVEPDDPQYLALQWDLWSQYGIDAPAAWDVTTGSPDVTIAVIDTGYLPHPDIAARITPGWDFLQDDGDPTDPSDCGSSHGLHVAGTVGASTDNGLGIAGIDWQARIVPIRILDSCLGGFVSDEIAAILWAAGYAVSGVPANPFPADVINLSLGGEGACDPFEQAAIDAAIASGVVVVVAAGNESADLAGTPTYSPASCDGVITVAATDATGAKPSYSNFGAAVEIAAPGGGGGVPIWSLGDVGPPAITYNLTGKQGTSMAAPHVAGVVSLALSVNPGLDPDEVTHLLQRTAQPFPAGSSCAGVCGAGIVDAAAAVTAAPRPGPPAPVSVVAGDRSATVTWGAPLWDGLAPLQATVITSVPAGGSCTVPAGVTTCVVAGLTNGTTYRFTAQSRAANGDGVASALTDAVVPNRTFTSVTPFRRFDTRSGEGGVPAAKVVPGATLRVRVAGRDGIPVGVAAVSMNVTATRSLADGFASVFPCALGVTTTSSLNYRAGQSVANAVIVPVDAQGDVCFTSSGGATDLIADVNGWFAPDAGYRPVGPNRRFDTRSGEGGVPAARIAPGATLAVRMVGAAGVPASPTVRAVSMNVTATRPLGDGFLSIFPCLAGSTATSSVNFGAGESVPNAVIVPVDANGDACFTASGAAVDVIVDVNGHVDDQATFAALTPSRVFDTRSGEGGVRVGRVAPGAPLAVRLTGRNGVPATGVGSVSLNVTSTRSVADGFLAVYPCALGSTATSSVNYAAGRSVANAVVVPVDAQGDVCFASSGGATDVVVDVSGWFAASG